MTRAAAVVALWSAIGRSFAVSLSSRIDEREPSGLESADVEANRVHVFNQLAYMVTVATFSVHIANVCRTLWRSTASISVVPTSPRFPVVLKF